jgi:GGDEF domain-containing protein
MLTTIAVVLAALVVVSSVLLSRRAAVRAGRRIDEVRQQLDLELRALFDDLRRVHERAQRAHDASDGELQLILDLDDLLGRICERAVDETGGQAAAIRVRGPGAGLVVGSYGAEDPASLLDAVVPPPGRRPYRALSVSWAISTRERSTQTFGAALVVPVVEDDVESGTLVVFGRDPSAFSPEATRALEALAQEAAPTIASARRFAQTARHDFGATARRRDETTPEPAAESEPLELFRERLAREIARAHALQQGLALLIVSVDEQAREGGGADETLAEIATRLGEGLRVAGLTTPIGAGEVGVLLPQANARDAESLYEALRSSYAGEAVGPPRQTLSAGITEVVHGDDVESALERARHALAQARQMGEGVVVVATAGGVPLR